MTKFNTLAGIACLSAVSILAASHNVARAATRTWDGGGVAGTDLGVAVNWSGDALPNGGASDIMEWNGTVAGPLSLSYTTGQAVLGATTGLSINVTGLQTSSLTVDGTAAPNLRLGSAGVTIASGAGAFTLGNGAGAFALTVANGTMTMANNSSNTATLSSDIAFATTGAGTTTFAFSGSGNWQVNGNLDSSNNTNNIVTKSGAGTLTLSGANTYTGTTTVNAGTLRSGAHNVLPDASAITVSGTGAGVTATLDLAGFTDTIASLSLGGSTATSAAAVTTGAGTLTLAGNVTYDATNNPLGATITGNLSLGSATRTFTVGNSTSAPVDLTIDGVISGSGAAGMTVNSTTAMVMQLTGSTSNTYTGLTTVSRATLELNKSGGAIAIPGNLTLQNTGANSNNATVTLLASEQIADTATVTLNAVSVNGVSTFAMGGNDETIGALTISNTQASSAYTPITGTSSATLTVNGPITLSNTSTVTPTAITLGGAFILDLGGSQRTVSVTNTQTGAIIISSQIDNGGIDKTGTATITLTGANTYTGATLISAGTLQIGNGATLGSLSTGSTITNNANLTFNRSDAIAQGTHFSGSAITGTGSLTKAGAGTLTLTAANIYGGATNISAGTLALSGGSNRLPSGTTVNFTGTSTLDVGSTSQTVADVSVSNGITGVVTGSGGTLALTGAAVTIGNSVAGTATLDMTNLSNLTYTNAVGTFGVQGVTTTGAAGVMTLSANNTITAGTLSVNPFAGTTATSILHLGQANDIDATTITVGSNGSGTLDFRAGLSSPTVSIRDSAGGSTGTFTVGISASQGTSSLADFTGGSVDIDVAILRLGIANRGAAGAPVNPTVSGTFTMNGGTLDTTTLLLGQMTVSTSGYTPSGAFNLNGGTAIVSTLTMADKISTAGNTIAATFTLAGGTLRAQLIQPGTSGAGGTITRTFNFNDGTIKNYDSSTDLTINNFGGTTPTFVLASTGTHTFDIDSGRTGTVNQVMSGAGGTLNKAGAGTLVLSAVNTYSGKTTIADGTLSFNNGNVSATGNQALGANAALDLGVAATSSGKLVYTGGAGTLAKNINVLGNGSDTIQNAGTGLLTLSGTITKTGTDLTLMGGANGINVTGVIQGNTGSPDSDLIVDNGTTTLSNANTYNGPTYIRSTLSTGILNANAVDALPTSIARSAVIMDDSGLGSSQLNLIGGFNQSILSLSGAASSLVNLNSNTLTIGAASGSTTFAGVISGASGSLIKDGTSTQVFTGASTYTGTTTVNGGTVDLDGSIDSSSEILINRTAGAAVNTNGRLLIDAAGTRTLGTTGDVIVGDTAFGYLQHGDAVGPTAATSTVSQNLVVGRSVGGDGLVDINNGTTMNVTSQVRIGSGVAIGTVNVNAGGTLNVNGNTTIVDGVPGTLNISGTFTEDGDLIVGNTAIGIVNQNSGSASINDNQNATGNLIISQTSGTGTYNLTGGTLHVHGDTAGSTTSGNTYVGGVAGVGGGVGIVNHSAGTFNNDADMFVGGGTAGSQYNLQAGTGILNFGDTNAGTQTLASTNPPATFNPQSTLTIGANGDFNFSGGTLMNVSTIDPNPAGTGGIFSQDGGRFVVGVDGGLDTNDPLTTRALTTIDGDFDQNGGTLALDIFGLNTRGDFNIPPGGLAGSPVDPAVTITDSDLLYVIGTATLDGTLEFDLNGITPETYGWYDVVVANEILISDGTLDLQGMTVWRIIDDPSNPGRQILQVAIPEPASIVLWSLIGLGLAVYGFRRIRRK